MNMKKFFAGFILAVPLTLPASAQPILRTDVAVNSAIVTVGDMFSNAGLNAERGMFRAPAPGTAGAVSVDVIRTAAKRVGITDFSFTASKVNVGRDGVEVSEADIKALIDADLRRRGIVGDSVLTRITLSNELQVRFAADTPEPVRLNDLRYTPRSGNFSARFEYAGYDTPVDISGRLELMVETAHLTQSLPLGSIIGASDVEMRPIPLLLAQNSGLAVLSDLVGKELKRPARAGMMLRPADVMEPHIISRSELVTIFYRKGPLHLTVKGQALNSAAQGEAVSVLNLVSKKIVHGIASDYGSVEMLSLSAPGTRS